MFRPESSVLAGEMTTAQAEMVTFWRNLGHRPKSVEELLRQPAVQPVTEKRKQKPPNVAQRERHAIKGLAKKYAVSPEEIRRWLTLAKGPCSICRRPPREGKRHPIDHCHRSGKIRAPLCSRCNTLVGSLECNRDLIPVALAYIQRFSEVL